MNENLFRKKAIEKISSPDQLTDYLRVTNPSVWIVLAAIAVFLAGLISWACVGDLETVLDAKAVVNDTNASVVCLTDEATAVEAGMTVRIASDEYIIARVDTDEYGRAIAYTQADIPDGSYNAKIILETIHPIEFLFKGGD